MERPNRYSPLFSVDTRNGDTVWELWIEGFETAVELRPEALVRIPEKATTLSGAW